MRKLFLLSFLIIATIAYGRKISENEAESIASDFLGSTSVQQNGQKSGMRRALGKNVEKGVDAPYYVFNFTDGKGFVIVSGDDRVPKILGYSDIDSFDSNNLPPQLIALLEQYEEQIKNIPANTATHDSWKTSTRASEEGGVILETAKWGQGAPYNSLCPIIDGVQAPTGCVATAMAIVMKYHNWPLCGRKKHTYWNYLTGEQYVADFTDFKPQWDAMLLSYKDEEFSEENATAVADLMYYAGMSANMQYSPTESGAGVLGIMTALRRYFNYSAGMDEVVIEQYGDDEWENRVRKDIEDNCPVFYYGSGTGAHAFVIDGYDNAGLFHVNWGWEGAANGYFALNYLTPDGMDFAMNNGMVAGIRPAIATDEIWSDLFMADDKYFGAVSPLHSINMSVSNIEQNVPFDAVTPCVAFPPQIVCDLGVAIVNKNNVIKQVLSSISYSSEPWDVLSGAMPMFNHLIAQCPVDKTDRLQIVAKELGDPDWLLVNNSKDICSSISVRNNVPYTANVRWDIDPRFSLEFFDRSKNNWSGDIIPATEANNRAGKFLIGGEYQFHPFEADANRGIFSAIRINDIMAHIRVNKAFTMGDRAIGVITAAPGDYDITIMGLFPGDEKKEIFNIKNTGDLGQYVSNNDCSHITDFTLSGSGTNDDFKSIGLNMPFIAKLDLSAYLPENDELSEGCFAQLPNLSKVILPNSVRSIGAHAFIGDALETVVIPESVNYIGDQAFNNYEGYFDAVNLTAVFCKATTPPEVGELPFGNNAQTVLYVMPGCKKAYVEHSYWSTFKEIIEDANPVMDIDEVTVSGIRYKVYPKYAEVVGPEKGNCPDEVVLQEAVVSNGRTVPVTSLAYHAFLYSTIKKVTVPESIVNWATGAFSCCPTLTDVEINSPITRLPDMTFESCISLKKIKLPNTIETIGQYAISLADGIKELVLPSALKEIQWNGIIGLRNLKKIVLPEDNTNFILEDGVLYSNDMTWLYLYPSGDDSRERFNIPEGVTNTFWSSISGKNLKEVVIPSSMTELTFRFIYNTPNLASLILHDGIVSVPDDCFELPKHLTLGRNISKFGDQWYRFDDAYGDYNIYCLNTNTLDNFRINSLFTDLRLFSGHLKPNIIFSDFVPSDGFTTELQHVFIPGKADWSTCNLLDENIHYMWTYEIDRANGKIKVKPLIDGLVIDAVTINNIRHEGDPLGIYYYTSTVDDNLDVVVDFTLNERQAMTTHYDANFNASLPDTNISGIEDILTDKNTYVRIFNLQGLLVYEGLYSEANLEPNYYIVVCEGKSTKVRVE